MPTIPIANPATVPAVPAFTPDRYGVRRVAIECDRATDARSVSLTPCPASASAWGPADAAEVSTPDLVAELLAAPDSPAKWAALAAVGRIADDLLTVAAYLMAMRA